MGGANGVCARDLLGVCVQRRIVRSAPCLASTQELIGQLAKEEPVYHDFDTQMRQWYHKTLGIGVTEKTDGGGKKKEGKGGKKKK